MKANYGYKDGSGDFFISIDTDKCTGCGLCVEACPNGVMTVGEDENDPFSEDEVASVDETERKKIKYTCAPCKGEGKTEPCIKACEPGAINHSW
ncbi:MAG: 4Fe-4S binding protein [Candidatus Thermoplasmatota archaeon]|jgi:NAD-dependent dihydropyrimidine dehydrogenase PreA subunit|nr:4Fe-4S binding protein [Candidatus Thermoplasmatota archaeon]